MTFRGIFLADGPSDLPLRDHLERLCLECGGHVEVSPIDPERLVGTGRSVEQRLRFLLTQGAKFDIAFVHRDAEAQDPAQRRAEIASGASSAGLVGTPVVPIVPVRMTEAWLLLDEAGIRRIAARPNGQAQLGLPKWHEAESIADPKQRLETALLLASETSGRRRARFARDFGRHRSLLLQRLDPNGPVAQHSAWKQLRVDVENAVAMLLALPREH